MPRHVAIVPHTHWDREWCEPYQTFRMQPGRHARQTAFRSSSVGPSYARFLLDGQMAVVDDYLEVRPESREPASGTRGDRKADDGARGMRSWTSSSSRERPSSAISNSGSQKARRSVG